MAEDRHLRRLIDPDRHRDRVRRPVLARDLNRRVLSRARSRSQDPGPRRSPGPSGRGSPRTPQACTAGAGCPSPRGSVGGSVSKDSARTNFTPRSAGPFAAQSRDEPLPYSFPARTPSGVPVVLVAHRGLVDAGHLAAREVRRPRALRLRRELVPKPDVREGPAHHHLVVPAPGSVRVEVTLLDTVFEEVSTCGRVRTDRARR